MGRFLPRYLLVVAVLGGCTLALLGWVVQHLPVPASLAQASGPAQSWAAVLLEGLRKPLGVLLTQVVVILIAARLAGKLLRRLGQPAVIGEILAGILLGPSLLGWMSPEAMGFLFPEASLAPLKLLSYLGVLLFMFVVGLDLDARHLARTAPQAVLISHSAILLPFLMGVCVAIALYSTQAPAGVRPIGFVLFMGISMSITAFPVLARILEERRLVGTPLGTTAIACAAVDDITAWSLLAVVLAVARASGLQSALLNLLLVAVYVVLMWWVLRPWIERLIDREFETKADESNHHGLITGALVFMCLSAGFTQIVGIHALFGAFLAGVLIPANTRFRLFLRERIETLSLLLLMPLFFAHTGLRTQVGLLHGWDDWLLCAGLIAVAITGKLVGAMLAARATGMVWRSAFAMGALMNTRGLMELVVLNIGYDLGILSPRLFTMMVIMALVTTAMTGPLLSLTQPRAPLRRV